jgi:anaerobic selenocysteine-containing dehydrogenase
MAYIGFQWKIIEPLCESKPQSEIAKALAARMGITDYDEETGESRLRELLPNHTSARKQPRARYSSYAQEQVLPEVLRAIR